MTVPPQANTSRPRGSHPFRPSFDGGSTYRFFPILKADLKLCQKSYDVRQTPQFKTDMNKWSPRYAVLNMID
ncbi:hypothetical protein DKX38_011041 [Salix brachista]|uniref:Uncharacterized protein n=1 Tax=Salix brachista TaxID=2182728 RepID=A0A5N5LXQ9_9ROSI|nr:hypothetical protein DKX38_011041 [Salix brachista]